MLLGFFSIFFINRTFSANGSYIGFTHNPPLLAGYCSFRLPKSVKGEYNCFFSSDKEYGGPFWCLCSVYSFSAAFSIDTFDVLSFTFYGHQKFTFYVSGIITEGQLCTCLDVLINNKPYDNYYAKRLSPRISPITAS